MANVDNAFGLLPVRNANGAVYNGSGSLYHVAASDAQVIAPGDPVIVTGTADANGIPTVTRATGAATNRITGVMLSIAQGKPQLDGSGGGFTQDSPLNTVASTSQFILVEDNPQVSYAAQFAGTLAVTDVSSTANLTAAASPADGKSGWEVGAVTGLATGQVRILRVRLLPENEVGEFAKIEVMINLPTQANDTVGQ